MYIVDNHFRSRKAPPLKLSIVPSAPEDRREYRNHDEGRHRVSRDYPTGVYAYLEYAEVEQNAHNAANYDAAEALDLN